MELLHGETLRSRLVRGELPWRKAVEIAVAVADGLAAAHAKGIIHRDLKPENIFLVAGDQVKILDFGLARISRPEPAQDPTSVPTETEPGVVVGTAAYMSPEQVRGKPAHAPSDLFSLGCVVYELISGRRAFARETGAQTMAAILEAEPPHLTELGKKIPIELERVVTQCLEKDPQARFQSAYDLGLALRAVQSLAAVTATRRKRNWLRRWQSQRGWRWRSAGGCSIGRTDPARRSRRWRCCRS
jgi:serine/threonine protein kinase